eukprot:COSAG05_NODE_1689_length_4272_cov_34.049125_1_plen_150_part_00
MYSYICLRSANASANTTTSATLRRHQDSRAGSRQTQLDTAAASTRGAAPPAANSTTDLASPHTTDLSETISARAERSHMQSSTLTGCAAREEQPGSRQPQRGSTGAQWYCCACRDPPHPAFQGVSPPACASEGLLLSRRSALLHGAHDS